jgi:hypothetical protein
MLPWNLDAADEEGEEEGDKRGRRVFKRSPVWGFWERGTVGGRFLLEVYDSINPLFIAQKSWAPLESKMPWQYLHIKI